LRSFIRLAPALLTIMTVVSGCGNKNLSEVTELVPAGSRIGYVSKVGGPGSKDLPYCPKGAVACEFIYISEQEFVRFQKDRKLDLILCEQSYFDDRAGTNIGLLLADIALTVAIPGAGAAKNTFQVPARTVEVISIYNDGFKDKFECVGLDQCRKEVERLLTKAQPGTAGEQHSKETIERYSLWQKDLKVRLIKNSIARYEQEIDHNMMIINAINLESLPISPEAERMKKTSEERIQFYNEKIAQLKNEAV